MVETFYASGERSSGEELDSQREVALESPLLEIVLESVGGYVCVLNEHRQILRSSQELLDSLGVNDPACIVGRRPGEVFQCENAERAPAGCGTSKRCAACGALEAILGALDEGETTVRECSLRMRTESGWDTREFKVKARPLVTGDVKMVILFFHDISSEKRRLLLERTFLHDIRNTVMGLMGWSELLLKSEQGEIAQRIVQLAAILNREVESHHLLYLAEHNILEAGEALISATSFMKSIHTIFLASEMLEDVSLDIVLPVPDFQIRTDEALLSRVVVNMVKNAIEATGSGGTVRFWHEEKAGHLTFLVHNDAFIPPETQLKIFRRSFSTKGGAGRGVGTYSMKLFGEQYLHGTVRFVSTRGKGTTFLITLPPKTLGWD